MPRKVSYMCKWEHSKSELKNFLQELKLLGNINKRTLHCYVHHSHSYWKYYPCMRFYFETIWEITGGYIRAIFSLIFQNNFSVFLDLWSITDPLKDLYTCKLRNKETISVYQLDNWILNSKSVLIQGRHR